MLSFGFVQRLADHRSVRLLGWGHCVSIVICGMMFHLIFKLLGIDVFGVCMTWIKWCVFLAWLESIRHALVLSSSHLQKNEPAENYQLWSCKQQSVWSPLNGKFRYSNAIVGYFGHILIRTYIVSILNIHIPWKSPLGGNHESLRVLYAKKSKWPWQIANMKTKHTNFSQFGEVLPVKVPWDWRVSPTWTCNWGALQVYLKNTAIHRYVSKMSLTNLPWPPASLLAGSWGRVQCPPWSSVLELSCVNLQSNGKVYPYKQWLVGGWTNPSEKYSSNWKSSPNRGENIKKMKPPPSNDDGTWLIDPWECCNFTHRWG